MRATAVLMLSAMCNHAGAGSLPAEALKVGYPDLHRLYKAYEAYVPTLEQYATRQGFRMPFEHLGTVVHEIVHIASASHQGYFIHGTYYEPYVTPSAWPNLRNRDVMPNMLSAEKGIMYSVYMTSTLDNRLGNIMDEVNAYSHVAPFVCRHERESAEKQVRNLVGLLHIVEAYLRVARIVATVEYSALLSNLASAGAIVTITRNAWSALAACGVPRQMVPRSETEAFVARLQ